MFFHRVGHRGHRVGDAHDEEGQKDRNGFQSHDAILTCSWLFGFMAINCVANKDHTRNASGLVAGRASPRGLSKLTYKTVFLVVRQARVLRKSAMLIILVKWVYF